MADVAHGSPPFNAIPPRRKDSRGGLPQPATSWSQRRTLANGLDNPLTRFPGTVNDTTIQRDKGPWLPVDNLRGTASGWYNWTAAGPPRPELHQRNVTMRIMQGTSRTRNLPNPIDPTVGLHSNPAVPTAALVIKFRNVENPRMTSRRYDRLSNARYSGQSYSATTRTQGGV